MGWTTPTTRAVGFLVTAAVWNTDMVDNLLALEGLSVPACRIVYEGSQVPYTDLGVSSPWEGEIPALPFDTVDYDPGGQADLVAGSITVPSTGLYLVAFGTQIGTTTAAGTYIVDLMRNGGQLGLGAVERVAAISGGIAGWITLTGSDIVSLTAGDVLTLYSLAYVASSSMPGYNGGTPSQSFLSAARIR